MRYLSVCAGIEAATCAWHPLGWTAAAYSEIEPFPRAVLAHHYPKVPLHGDFTTIRGDEYGPIDLLVGGTPCQDFSVAGLRAGLDGERGNLTLEFVRLADRTKPDWVVWENVPGVLSIDGGRAFGAFLGGLAQLGYGFAYRVLDAQYFGLAQRRARVFVVGHLGDWRRAAAVLFERESLRWHPAPCRETWARIADNSLSRALTSSHTATDRLDPNEMTFIPVAFSAKDHGADAGEISPTLRSGGHDKSHANGGVMPAVAIPILEPGKRTGVSTTDPRAGLGVGKPGDPMFTLQRGAQHAVAFESRYARNGRGAPDTIVPPLKAQSGETGKGDAAPLLATTTMVRRLTPRECERLQGFPDDYTLVTYRGKPAADGPRYKALGNSMAVPVMAWIGRRIALIQSLSRPEAA